VGNSSSVDVEGVGTCRLRLSTGHTLVLHDVLYAPNISRNLVSVVSLSNTGYVSMFQFGQVQLLYDSDCVGTASLVSGLMVLDTVMHADMSLAPVSYHTVCNDPCVWHSRLCHIGQNRMSRLTKQGYLGSVDKAVMPTCEHCIAGKISRKPFGKAKRAEAPLHIIHSDICGPMSVRARHGASYFITFIDDYSRYGYVYLIAHKSEALSCFILFLTEVENQKSSTVKTLRTDRGREYLSDEFRSLCEGKGIVRQLTIPRTP
jgi:hypothetical protein